VCLLKNSGFINYENSLTDGICSLAVEMNDFVCSDILWLGLTNDNCVNAIMEGDGMFGEITTCWNETWNSLDSIIQDSISVIQNCIVSLELNDTNYMPGNDNETIVITSTEYSESEEESNDSWGVRVYCSELCLFLMILVWTFIFA